MDWLVLLLFTIFSAHATSCGDLEKAWRAKYTVDFKVTWNLKGFQCPGGESTVAQALWDLEHLEFEANADGSKNDFYEMVRSRTDVFARDHTNKADLAYHESRTTTVTRSFYNSERWDRASTFVHEARHEDADDPGHIICKAGLYNKGENQGCDRTFWDGQWKGSGFVALLLIWKFHAPSVPVESAVPVAREAARRIEAYALRELRHLAEAGKLGAQAEIQSALLQRPENERVLIAQVLDPNT